MVNDSSENIVVLDVSKRNVPVPRASVEVSEEKPGRFSVVKFDPNKPVPARVSQEELPLTYAVCPFCRERTMGIDDGVPTLKCEECGKEAPVDWENPC